jgi:hypothetical protein
VPVLAGQPGLGVGEGRFAHTMSAPSASSKAVSVAAVRSITFMQHRPTLPN